MRSGLPVREFYDIARNANLTRLPVLDEAQQKFVGIANLFDVLSSEGLDSSRPINDFMRPPSFIRDDTSLVEVFPRLRLSRQPMCLVTGAQGEVVGLITAEDILQQIVGKL